MKFIFSILQLTVFCAVLTSLTPLCQAQRIPTGAERQEILDAHNRARGEVAAKWNVSGMPALTWSDAAANHGFNYISGNGCGFAHSNSYAAGFGENLAMGHRSWTSAIYDSWSKSEENCYDAVAPSWGQCTCTCGHYTAVNWQRTNVVGCAICDSNRLYICNYGESPPNFQGQNVFQAGSGTPCSSCPSEKPNCVNNLCSASPGGPNPTTTNGGNPTTTQATTTNQPNPTNPPGSGSCEILAGRAHPNLFQPITFSGAPSADACCDRCQANSQCRSWTFGNLNPLQPGSPLCGLYSTPITNGGTPNGAATSGNVVNGPAPTQPQPTNGNPCSANPCANGACSASGSSFTCDCESGWEGDRCDQDIDDCSPNPCLNGGTCTDRGVNDFSCVCPTTHTGVQCQREVTTTQATTTQATTTQASTQATTQATQQTTQATTTRATTTQATTTQRTTQATQATTTQATTQATLTRPVQTPPETTNPPQGECARLTMNPCQFGECVPEPTNSLGWVCQCDPGYQNEINPHMCNRENDRTFRFSFNFRLEASEIEAFVRQITSTLTMFLNIPESRIKDVQVVESDNMVIIDIIVSGAADFEERATNTLYDSMTRPSSVQPSDALAAMDGFSTLSSVECLGSGCPVVNGAQTQVNPVGAEGTGSSLGLMIGAAVGAVIGVILIAIAGVWGYKRYQNNKLSYYDDHDTMSAPSVHQPYNAAQSPSVQMQPSPPRGGFQVQPAQAGGYF